MTNVFDIGWNKEAQELLDSDPFKDNQTGWEESLKLPESFDLEEYRRRVNEIQKDLLAGKYRSHH